MVGVTVQPVDSRLGPPPPAGLIPKFVYGLTLMAVLGGFLFGYDCGVVAGAMVIIRDYWGPAEIDDLWQQLVVSITVAGAAIFALVGAPLNDRLGRKPVILISSGLFTIGAIIMGVSPDKHVLLVGRFVVGAAIGMSSMTIPSYVAEASPPEIRGRLVTTFQLSITVGFWMGPMLDAAFSYLPLDISWRLMLGVAGIPSAVQFIGFWFMPESPRWLVTHGKLSQGRAVLEKVCSTPEIAEWELRAIMLSYEESERERERNGGEWVLKTMLKTPTLRRALTVGCLLQFFQQFCGINTVMYYSTSIIQMAGIRDVHTAIWLTTVTSGVNFLCTFIGIYLVEKIGRRRLLLGSTVGVTLSMLALSGGFLAIAREGPVGMPRQNVTDPSEFLANCSGSPYRPTTCDHCSYLDGCGFCYHKDEHYGVCMSAEKDNLVFSVNGSRCSSHEIKGDMVFANGWCPSDYSFIPVIAMVAYLCCFSSGLGPIPWTMNAEIYPHFARSTGNAMSTATNWTVNLFVALTFLTLARAMTRQGAFLMYAIITTVGFTIFYLIVPETKNKTLEEVEDLFRKPWFGKDKISPRSSTSSTSSGYKRRSSEKSPSHDPIMPNGLSNKEYEVAKL